MTDAPSRTGHRVGPSQAAVPATRQGPAQARRRNPPERRRRAAARRRRLRGLSRLALLVVVLFATIWVGVHVANATSDASTVTEHHYVVRAGDTLWNVARRVYPGNVDTRQLVFDIEQRNGLASADIRPGETLILPILPQ
ncbi:MAG TPA: LysM peptidoglycan-binding domain-containing protein [Thermoleophilia bacterium]|nr:LysM peptidoglycan-binding domain-containing protein [Thermoleophilia bacterium]